MEHNIDYEQHSFAAPIQHGALLQTDQWNLCTLIWFAEYFTIWKKQDYSINPICVLKALHFHIIKCPGVAAFSLCCPALYLSIS